LSVISAAVVVDTEKVPISATAAADSRPLAKRVLRFVVIFILFSLSFLAAGYGTVLILFSACYITSGANS
jgi:hypothetical protein